MKQEMKNIHVLPTDKASRLYHWKGNNIFNSRFILRPIAGFCDFNSTDTSNQNIYITSDEEIKEGEYQLYNPLSNFNNAKVSKAKRLLHNDGRRKKIILTTDQDLIKDGVQAIDDEFLEWFVKNPNCEWVEVEKYHGINTSIAEVNAISGDDSLNWQGKSDLRDYKIIIPKEEPKKLNIKQVKECDGNNGDGCFMDSCGHNCGCFITVDEPKQETLEEVCNKVNFINPRERVAYYNGLKNGAKWQAERMFSEEEAHAIWKAGQEYWKTSGGSTTFEELIEQFKK